MSLISRLFSRKSDDCLARGDALFASRRFFEARGLYEQGLQRCLKNGEQGETTERFRSRIADANHEMAVLNIAEAEYALGRDADAKAVEHLELALSLTDDPRLRENCQRLLADIAGKGDTPEEGEPSTCGSCCAPPSEAGEAMDDMTGDLSDHDYYDLMIRQLPAGMYPRYSGLNDEFRRLYLAAGRDENEEALEYLEAWYTGEDEDIYCYEKGMLLQRLGREREAETCLRNACSTGPENPLPRLGLVQLLIEGERFTEAVDLLDAMISGGMLSEQARMLRGDLYLLSGETEKAIGCYGTLLTTPHARLAAEKVHHLLLQEGRTKEAAALFKKYLAGCRH